MFKKNKLTLGGKNNDEIEIKMNTNWNKTTFIELELLNKQNIRRLTSENNWLSRYSRIVIIQAIGRLQLRHKNREPTPSWLISNTKMASALRMIEFWAYYEKLDGPEKERSKKKVSMCGFDPYETREYTKHTNQINQDGAQWLDVTSCANNI